MNISSWTILIIGIVALFILAVVIRSVSKKDQNKGSGKGNDTNTVHSENAAIDPKIVAIIVAAISAASGKPVNAFRIATLERTGISTPVWGHIDRMARSPRGR